MQAPSAKRSTLFLTAGLVWTAVGLGMMAASVYWMVNAEDHILPATAAGLLAGWCIYRFGFLRLVRENIARVRQLAPEKERICVFAFQAWRGYLIVPVMIFMGYTLRHLPIARIWLVPAYLGIGLGLLLASIHYYVEIR
jgi:hypothetical protein